MALSFAGAASAADVDASFRAGYSWSDNITRVASNTIDEQVLAAGFSLDYIEETRKLDILFRSSFDFLHYTQDTFDDEIVGGGIFSGTYWFVDERLNWVLQDNYGQQLIDPLAAPTPSNRQNVNFLTTGPTLILPLGTRTSLINELRYSLVEFDQNGLDNTRKSARVAVERTLSDDSAVSLNTRYRRIEFDSDSGAPPFDIVDAFVRYASSTARNTINVDLGYSKAEVDRQKSDGYLLALSWDRALSPLWTASFTGGSGYSDQAELFRELQNAGNELGGTINANGGGEQPFRFDYLGVAYKLSAPRSSLSLAFGGNREDYDLSPNLNRDAIFVRISADRQLSRDFSAQASADYVSRDYKTINRKDDDIRAVIAVRYAIGSAWLMSLQAQYNDRESTVALASFTENRYVLQLTYIPRWGRPAGL